MSDNGISPTGSPLVPQEHGGAILVGNLGNRGGGRRPSPARQAAKREVQLRAHLADLPIITTLEDAQSWLCAVAALTAKGLLSPDRAAVIIRAVEVWIRMEHARQSRIRIRDLERQLENLERQGNGDHSAS